MWLSNSGLKERTKPEQQAMVQTEVNGTSSKAKKFQARKIKVSFEICEIKSYLDFQKIQ